MWAPAVRTSFEHTRRHPNPPAGPYTSLASLGRAAARFRRYPPLPVHLYSGPSPQFIEDATSHCHWRQDRGIVLRPLPVSSAVRGGLLEELAESHGRRGAPRKPHRSRGRGRVATPAEFSSARRDAHRAQPSGQPHGVIVELKQWSTVEPTHVPECVLTSSAATGGGVAPSAQVSQYRQYLADTHSAFTSGEIGLLSCAFLHNMQYDGESEIFAESPRRPSPDRSRCSRAIVLPTSPST